MEKIEEVTIDYVAYAKYLEDVIIYAGDVIEGKYEDIALHKILPVKDAIKTIHIRRELH